VLVSGPVLVLGKTALEIGPFVKSEPPGAVPTRQETAFTHGL
jgi:hypothetical protein